MQEGARLCGRPWSRGERNDFGPAQKCRCAMLGFPADPMSQITLGLLLHVRFEPPLGVCSPEHRLPS